MVSGSCQTEDGLGAVRKLGISIVGFCGQVVLTKQSNSKKGLAGRSVLWKVFEGITNEERLDNVKGVTNTRVKLTAQP